MSRPHLITVLALTVLLGASTVPSTAAASERAPMRPAARERISMRAPARERISMRQARRAALAQVPGGTVRSSELEREDGRLIYSFDIHAPGHSGIQEVHVDAYRGNVLKVEHENAVKERTERIGEGVKRAVH